MLRIILSSLTLWTLVLCTSGCGVIFETSGVARNFRSVFDCDDVSVTGAFQHYRAEGCGTVAHYTCIDTDASSEEPIRRAKPGGGRLLGAIVGSMLLNSMEVDSCVLSYAERGPRPPKVEALAVGPSTRPRDRALRSELPVRGGSLTLYGKPERHPGHFFIDVHATARLAPEPCAVKLFDDGIELAILQRRRVDPYTERILLARAAIAGVKDSVRVAGEVCGFSFELDPLTRQSVALFDARFGELARGGQLAQAPR